MSSNSQNKLASYSSIVGSIIANYRKNMGLGQSEVSSSLNISQATWSRIERGSTAVNVSQLSEIAELFDIAPSKILRDADKMTDELKDRGIQVSHYHQKDNEAMFILGATALIGLAALIFGNE